VGKITEPSRIVEELIKRNIIDFGQAKATAFTTPPVSEELGYKGRNEMTNLIISNQLDFPYQQLPEHVRLIFDKLIDGKKLQEISNNILYEDFCGGFKKWVEKTTTSPSGRHLEHYKVLMQIQINDDKKAT
jgi:hypothetical protein